MRKSIFISVCFLLLHIKVHAQKFEFNGNKKRETISFRMIKNLMIIPLTINGKGPFNFVLDTGVGLMIISDPRLIDSLQISNLKSIKISGLGEGEDLSAYISPGIELALESTKAENISAAVLKTDVFELSNYAGINIHGLIGYEFFNSFIVRINFINNTLTLFRPETNHVPRKGFRIPISIEERKPYVISEIVLESGEKLTGKFIIDTGAGHPVSLETNDGVPFKLPENKINANLGIGLTGPINGYVGRIKSLKIGKYILEDVITAFPDHKDLSSGIYPVSRNGNMGIAVLKRFNVVFDYHRSSIYIKPSFKHKEPFEHDMTGMELSSAGDNFEKLIINRVEPNSSADIAGLEKGDEILAINFKPVSEMKENEIENMFKPGDERNFVIDIIRTSSKTIERVILRLKKRI